MCRPQWRHFSQSLGVVRPVHFLLCYLSESLLLWCVICKKHRYRIGSAIALPSEKKQQKVTVTVMVSDCTISISSVSAVFKYYMIKNKSDTLCLNWKSRVFTNEWMFLLTCIQLLTSASIIYHYDYSTDCHMSLRVVQNFYRSSPPPKWRQC